MEAKGLLQLWKHGSMVKNKMDVDWSELLLLKGTELYIKRAALLHEITIHEVWITLQAVWLHTCTAPQSHTTYRQSSINLYISFSYEVISNNCV